MKLNLPDGKGGIRTIEVSDNTVINVENVMEDSDWELPTMSESVKGGAKLGKGLVIVDDETLKVDLRTAVTYGYSEDFSDINVAIGGIVLGSGLYLDGDTLNVAVDTSLPSGTILPQENNFYFVNNIGETQAVTLVGLTYENGSLQADSYFLPTMNETLKGGAKLGEGLYMNGDFLNVSVRAVPVATKQRLGGIIVGDGLSVTESGILSCTISSSTIESIVSEVVRDSSESHGIRANIITIDDETEAQPLIAQINNTTIFCVCYRVKNASATADSGELVLSGDYYETDFKIRGDDNKLVSTVGSLYDDNANYTNLSQRKSLQNGYCVVPITSNFFDTAFNQGVIAVEWGTNSDWGNVVFKGTQAALPDNPKHGWLCFVPSLSRFYIYDETAKKWRWWNVQGY